MPMFKYLPWPPDDRGMMNRMYSVCRPLVATALLGALLLLTPAPTASAAPPPGAVRIPSTIDATGVDDVTAELNEWFAAVPNGTLVRFPTKAVYRVEGTLEILQKEALLIEGNGATIRATTDGSGAPPQGDDEHLWPRNRAHVRVRESKDITIRRLKVQSINTEATYERDLEAQHGFSIGFSDNVLIEDAQVNDVFGDFVAIVKDATRVTVRRGQFTGAGRQGFSVNKGEDVLFEDFTMERVGRSGVDLEPFGDSVIRRVTVRNGEFHTPIENRILANLGNGAGIEDVLFQDNAVYGRAFQVSVNNPNGGPRLRYRFVGNTSDTPINMKSYLIVGADHVSIVENVQPYRGDRVREGALFEDACGVVKDNDFEGAPVQANGVQVCRGPLQLPAEAVPATPPAVGSSLLGSGNLLTGLGLGALTGAGGSTATAAAVPLGASTTSVGSTAPVAGGSGTSSPTTAPVAGAKVGRSSAAAGTSSGDEAVLASRATSVTRAEEAVGVGWPVAAALLLVMTSFALARVVSDRRT